MPIDREKLWKLIGTRTQAEVAQAAGMKQSHISRLLHGHKVNLTIKTLDALADALGCESRDLLERKKK